MRKQIRKIMLEDNFLSLAGNLTTAASGLAAFALLARQLDSHLFGQWVLFIAGGSLIEMLRLGITQTGVISALSGAGEKQRSDLMGANALINLVATAFIAAILVACRSLFGEAIQDSGYQLFFSWYPLMAFINLPWNNALSTLQADRKFGWILTLRAVNSLSFLIVLWLGRSHLDLTKVIWSMLAIHAMTSLVSILAGWDGLKKIPLASRQTLRQILQVGKYTSVTLVGTNLLRSADTLIISLSPLGSHAVALYSIPLKLTELQQIPLRSFAATAFPKMARARSQGDLTLFKKLFYEYAGAMTYLFAGMSLGTFLFADFFVLALGGEQYTGLDALTGVSAAGIVRVLSLYGLLLPIDRMTGIGLDSLGKPNINAIKVFFMVCANILGDIVAVFVFQSLLLVAVSSILFTLLGIYIGMFFLGREVGMEYKGILPYGMNFYRSRLTSILGRGPKMASA